MDLMCNAGIILAKNKVLHGIRMLFEDLEGSLLRAGYYIDNEYLKEVLQASPKISKGEQYLGLPYLVLDYPRAFDSLHIFAIRNLFWWGHEFSSTLHLAGKYKEELQASIEAAYPQLAKRGYYIGVSEDPWQHHFEEDNYAAIAGMDEESFKKWCGAFDHLKIAKPFRLTDVHFVSEDLEESWKFLMGICAVSGED
jgi:hypothetical protein